jgi:hypothetical protein
MNMRITYDPCIYGCKVSLNYEKGKELKVMTEKPMLFSDAVKVDFIHHDRFLYERKITETKTLYEIIREFESVNYGLIMKSNVQPDIHLKSQVTISNGDGIEFSLEVILDNIETSSNQEVKRIHRILQRLFEIIEMSAWYDYDKWSAKK